MPATPKPPATAFVLAIKDQQPSMEVVESEALGMEVAELENDAVPTSKAAEPKSATVMHRQGHRPHRLGPLILNKH